MAFPDLMVARRHGGAGLVALAMVLLGSIAQAQTVADIRYTRHNLSATGPGTIRALTETRICIFCHTPHNAAPLSPLWNKDLEPQNYIVYASPTLVAGPLPQPSGPTKLCLSCHDGTIAMGAVVNPAGGINMAGTDVLPSGSLANFGLDLSGHHPVSFSYASALPNPELAPAPPADLLFGGSDEMHCTTCHDPHSDEYGKFLVKDNRYSALCITCHQMNGWNGSAHATSSASVGGVLPRPPKTWPTYTQLGEWGCEVCHTPHFAPTAPELLNFTTAPPEPFSCTSAGCHTSEPAAPHLNATRGAALVVGAPSAAGGAMVDIGAQSRKASAHREIPGAAMVAVPATSAFTASSVRTATCVDCHNPHLTFVSETEAPYASGLLAGASGIDRNGMPVMSVQYEYEICFKCHADYATDFSYVPRVIDDTNKRREFDTSNVSYHPVVGMGKALDIPSIPSSFEPAMSSSSMIYCSSCHSDDEGGSRGPHGSQYAPILRERYETADNTPESYDSYALCYRCHERNSILGDESFKGHKQHLDAGAPCSACHDAHGISNLGGIAPADTGSHTHLINFDTRIALPKQGAQYPVFTEVMGFSGSCDLVCHGVAHDGATYP